MRTIGVKRNITAVDFDFVDRIISPEPRGKFLEALASADYVVCALPKTPYVPASDALFVARHPCDSHGWWRSVKRIISSTQRRSLR